MASATDTFDGAETTLVTDWNTLGSLNGIGESGGVAINFAGGDSISYWDPAVTTFTANHYAEVVIGTANNDGGPAVRCSGSTAYSVDLTPGSNSYTVYKWSAGSGSAVGSGTTSGAMVNGDTYRLSVTTTGGNAVLTVTRNSAASSPATITDSTSPLLSGQPGMHIFAGTLTYASWSAADLAAPAPPPDLRLTKTTLGLSPWAVRRM
jgi:hypothetical protein